MPSECPNYDIPALGFDTIKDGLTKAGFYKKLEAAEKVYAAAADRLKSTPASSTKRAEARQKMIEAYEKRRYWREKLRSFSICREELDAGFSRRQLAATGVMARHALQFLKSKYENVYANSGTATAFARREWGLQKQSEKKERTDHTHHVIDALVIAALDRDALNQISYAYHDERPYLGGKLALELTYPWKTFPEDVYKAVDSVLVKHLTRHNETKQAKRKKVYLTSPTKDQDGNIIKHVRSAGDTVRGMLHKQTYYGKIMDNEQNIRAVLRTPLDVKNFETMESFELIVDKAVREAVVAQANSKTQAGIAFKDIFSTAFHMKTKNGTFDGPIIKKVRIFRDDIHPLTIKPQTYTGTSEYKKNYYAETSQGGNFMVALYRDHEKHAGQRFYNYELISLWQWAKEHRSQDYIPPQKRTDKGEFIGIINPGTSVLFYKDSPDELKKMSYSQLSQRLYKITVFERENKRIRMHLYWHREAREKKEIEKSSEIKYESGVPLLRISPSTYQNHTLFEGIDFEISVTGEIIFKE